MINLPTETHVTFTDVTKKYYNAIGANDGTKMFKCTYGTLYIGYISFDYDTEFYMFYPSDEHKFRYSENVLYDIAEKLFEINKERKLN